ncbi:uncharacterized protein THITE_2088863 [Thermothielavioides terrestris NRRL 8126]|uniref:Uncharacterized protein n=1 Tax=Thermothielavioides terrestris (strain ATCC 38088 / NRRL 8126) TaxID=578455 RepID=G2R184_THETT|nr:uncharacterized protein THITE_2088863 [Thermothielavioides terrestris NRRL 8126]AEO67374.1 hypothetical protein THITE_2088863 [Thermothielavioides terrestris NRRL 8126]
MSKRWGYYGGPKDGKQLQDLDELSLQLALELSLAEDGPAKETETDQKLEKAVLDFQASIAESNKTRPIAASFDGTVEAAGDVTPVSGTTRDSARGSPTQTQRALPRLRKQKRVERHEDPSPADDWCFACGGELVAPGLHNDGVRAETSLVLGCGHIVGSECLTCSVEN